MKIEDIDDCITQYHALERAVRAAAMTHIKEAPSKRYVEIDAIYVEAGKVHVHYGYSGPYSGSGVVKLLAEEIAFCEPKVVVKPEEPLTPSSSKL